MSGRKHTRQRQRTSQIRPLPKNDEEEQFVAVIEIPPVESAVTAVRIQIEKDAKGGK